MPTDWVEHPDHPDLYYRREGRTVHLAGRDVVEGKPLLPGRLTYDTRGPDPDIKRRICLFCGRDDCRHMKGRPPVIHVSAEAAAPSKRLTLAELAAFVDQARAAGVPDHAGLNVTTKGIGHLRKIRTEEGTVDA